MSGPVIRVLMVCTGNICRSPTAEAVLRHRAQAAGWAGRIHVDSAGTTAYHVGEPPDPRSQAHAILRGYDLAEQRARQVCDADFERFDWILAMDRGHLSRLNALCPPSRRHGVKLLMDFAPAAWPREVGDPYYGGAQGFEAVLDQVEAACDGLLVHLAAGRPEPGGRPIRAPRRLDDGFGNR